MYRRTLAIWEKMPDLDVSFEMFLESYAKFLRDRNRITAAEEIELRAQQLRAGWRYEIRI